MAGPYTPPKLAHTPFPDLFTLVARQNPQRPFVQIIREHLDGPTDAIRFTWSEVIQHAQNAAADVRHRWAENHSNDRAKQRSAQPREPGSPPVVVGVLATNGYDLYVNVLACLLNRWTVLLISPRNSPAGIEHILRTSNSSLLLVEPNRLEFGHTMERDICGLDVETMATLDPLATGPAPSPLTPLTPEQLTKEMEMPVFYLHTSGSTGHPKIISWSHEFVISGARTRLLDDAEFIGCSYYCMPPIIHIMGVCVYFLFAVAHANLLNFVSSPIPKPPSAAALIAHLPFIDGGLALVLPSILEDLHSLGPEAVKKVVEGTRFIVFGGAPLSPATGNALVAAGLKISTGWGSTEIGQGTMHTAKKRPEDWEYMIFREGYEWHFLPVDDRSNLRDLIVGPGKDGCPAVINHENPRGYTSNDLWEPHPTIPGLWKHKGRKGDVTVLSNGEKSDNKQIEDLFLQDKRILYVQVFGSGRPMNGVIIQPANPAVPSSQFRAQIHPTITHANSILPRHSRIIPELVIVATPDRPFATTDKGTVKKKETLERFEREIEEVYEDLEQGGAGATWAFEGSVMVETDLVIYFRRAVQIVLGSEVADEADLFEHGFDSLLSLRLRAAVVSVVKQIPTSSHPVPRNVVYTSPSIKALATYVRSRAAPSTSGLNNATEERIRQSIAKYSADFIPHIPGSRVMGSKVVALSGSTGSLGSSMLGLLLLREDVEKIYLLNRKGDESQELRQARGLKERGLDPKMLDARKGSIIFLDIDLSRRNLGLADKDYEDLRDNVTHIIHAAWHLNFNYILESYERVHIAGVRHFIDLALASTQAQPPRLTFLSTISAAGKYQGLTVEPSIGERGENVLVPEVPIDDPSIPFDLGYGQSKYVGERVIVNAVSAGLRATIIRVGQLSGVTTNGAWAPSEYVPIMFTSSLALGMVPDDLPSVRWVPSDIAASAIVKQAFEDCSPLEYFSVESPYPTPWNVVVQALSAVSSKPLRPVTFAAWLEHIRKSNPDPKEVPAVKLLDFYQGLAQGGPGMAALGWDKSVKLAPELAFGEITGRLVENCVRYQQETARRM